jgi:signal transduction histidine kinase
MAQPERAKIFVVDDDAGLVRLVQKALDREGFQAASASSGKEAIAWLTENTADLMLLDLKLEDIEGKELVSQLVNLGRNIPFIIITGQGDERVAVDMMKRGALDYIVKDVQFIEFVPTVVRQALDKLETQKQLTATRAALEESKMQLLMVSEREQRRIGAELHDGLGQVLTAIELRCHALQQDLPSDRIDLQEQISQIGQYLREAVSQTRSLARGLSPVKLGCGGVLDALSELAVGMSKGSIRCIFEESDSPALDDLAAGHLFRIAQEAVNNAVKHSGATEIIIRLTNRNGTTRLEVADNGKGLPENAERQPGLGLPFMRHRASVIGANLEIKSSPGKGVKVICELRQEN